MTYMDGKYRVVKMSTDCAAEEFERDNSYS